MDIEHEPKEGLRVVGVGSIITKGFNCIARWQIGAKRDI
jgi:hypothetical protein